MIGTYITPPCLVCGQRTEIELDVSKVARWTGGEYIQTVWPELSPDRRDLIKLGLHPECGEKLYAQTLEEEDWSFGLNSEAVNQ